MRVITNLNGTGNPMDIIDIDKLEESLSEIYMHLDSDPDAKLDASFVKETLEECHDALISMSLYLDRNEEVIKYLELLYLEEKVKKQRSDYKIIESVARRYLKQIDGLKKELQELKEKTEFEKKYF